MAGIVGFGASVPRYRLPRDVIAAEWGHPSMGGEKAVAGPDEDSLTLAVDAALNATSGGEASALGAVYFASTTSPYREKQSAATIAAVLDAPPATRTADITDSVRAGTSALRAALDFVRAGGGRALVCAGDCRMGEPDSLAEQSTGDAGAALVIGGDGERVLAEVLGAETVTADVHGSWRTDEQRFVHAFPGAFEAKLVYAPLVIDTVHRLLAVTQTAPGAIATAVIAAAHPRLVSGVAKALGLDPKRQVQDSLWTVLGDTGVAQPLLLLGAALERAKPGDVILVVGYGDGVDALLVRATDAIAQHRPRTSVFAQIERKRLLPSYGRYARFRQLIRGESAREDLSTPVVLFRDRRAVLALEGGRCPRCEVVQFPRQRVCIECGYRDGLAAQALARRGTLFTFTNDHLFEGPESPTPHGVVDLEGGGRFYTQLTDVDPEQIEIDMPLELTFRKFHDGSGLRNYFWKARPV